MQTPVAAPFVAALVVTAVFCALAAGRVWPLVDGDGPAYFPPAVEWSLGQPLTNPVWLAPLDDRIDGPGGRRYIYHGFLYELVVGEVGRAFGGGPEATVRGAYVVHWLAAFIAALAVLSWTDVRGALRSLLAGLLPLAALALSLAWHGRVEPLVILLIGVVCLAWRLLRRPWREVCAGIGTALILFTSPAVGLLAGCVLVAALVYGQDAGLWRRFLTAASGWLLGAGLAIWVYPYPILDWVGGVRRHSSINLSLPMWQDFGPTWVTRPDLPLFGLSVGLLILAATSRVVTMVRPMRGLRRTAFVSLLLLFFVGVARIAFVKTEASYNAGVWIPLWASLAVSGPRSRWRVWATVAVLALPAIGLARSTVVLARQFDSHAAVFSDLRAKIRELAPQGCAVTHGLWLAAADVTGVTIESPAEATTRFAVVQETNAGQTTPPDYPGYKLLTNHFAPGISVLGVPISRTSGGWEFAVYECVDARCGTGVRR